MKLILRFLSGALRQVQQRCHMQTAWIRMRLQVTRRLTGSKLFDTRTTFSQTLSDIEAIWKLKQTWNLAGDNLFCRLRVKTLCLFSIQFRGDLLYVRIFEHLINRCSCFSYFCNYFIHIFYTQYSNIFLLESYMYLKSTGIKTVSLISFVQFFVRRHKCTSCGYCTIQNILYKVKFESS